jgi:hypothetical protein
MAVHQFTRPPLSPIPERYSKLCRSAVFNGLTFRTPRQNAYKLLALAALQEPNGRQLSDHDRRALADITGDIMSDILRALDAQPKRKRRSEPKKLQRQSASRVRRIT